MDECGFTPFALTLWNGIPPFNPRWGENVPDTNVSA